MLGQNHTPLCFYSCKGKTETSTGFTDHLFGILKQPLTLKEFNFARIEFYRIYFCELTVIKTRILRDLFSWISNKVQAKFYLIYYWEWKIIKNFENSFVRVLSCSRVILELKKLLDWSFECQLGAYFLYRAQC